MTLQPAATQRAATATSERPAIEVEGLGKTYPGGVLLALAESPDEQR